MTQIKISGKRRFKRNPRKISDEQLNLLKNHMEELGDLSGIVYCRKQKAYVGGNQRSRILEGAEVKVVEKFDEPTAQKTVLLGYVDYKGERFNYREVEFTKEQFEKANIVANNDGGEFDWDALDSWNGDLLKEWGMELPDRYDIPMVENPDALGKGGVNNKYMMNRSLMLSVNRSTFHLKEMTEEEKRLVWDTLDEIAEQGQTPEATTIMRDHLIEMAKQLKNEILSASDVSERPDSA